MSDGLVTYDDAARWLPRDVKRELLMALRPDQRGWWTREEADADGGCFVAGISFERAESQYFRVGW